MPTQKSLVLPAAQANWEVKVTDVPTPGPQDVLVKIAATALNPLDWKIQAFGLYVQKYPYIAGCEAAGTVEEVGGEVKNLAKGDKMYALLYTWLYAPSADAFCSLFQGDFANTHATFQQYCLVPAERTSKVRIVLRCRYTARVVPEPVARHDREILNGACVAVSPSLVSPARRYRRCGPVSSKMGRTTEQRRDRPVPRTSGECGIGGCGVSSRSALWRPVAPTDSDFLCDVLATMDGFGSYLRWLLVPMRLICPTSPHDAYMRPAVEGAAALPLHEPRDALHRRGRGCVP